MFDKRYLFRRPDDDNDEKEIYMLGGPLGILVRRMSVQGFKKITSKAMFFYDKSRLFLYFNFVKYLLVGLTYGFFIDFRINGVGYKAESYRYLTFYELGHSHYVLYKLVTAVFAGKAKYRFVIFGSLKELMFDLARQLKNISYPDSYKGKGFRFSFEKLKLKVGKQRQR